MARTRRGSGSLYTRPGTNIIWCSYYRNGKQVRESTGTDNKRKAQNFLDDRRNAVKKGENPVEQEKVMVSAVVLEYLVDMENRELASASDAKDNWRVHLSAFFGHMRCLDVGTATVSEYIARRKSQPIKVVLTKKSGIEKNDSRRFPSNGAINRELALLRAAMNHAAHSDPPKINYVPTFHLLPEAPPRKRYLKDDEYASMAEGCGKVGLWLRTIFEIYYSFGWRKNEPVEKIRVHQIDLIHRTIQLDDSKNGARPAITMPERLFELVKACLAGKVADDLAFTRADGSPIGDFRRVWKTVTKNAGVPWLRVHDLRRTGARNLRRLGVGESTIMKIGGWKTAAMFRRYDIVDEADLRQAAEKLDEKHRDTINHSLSTSDSNSNEQKVVN